MKVRRKKLHEHRHGVDAAAVGHPGVRHLIDSAIVAALANAGAWGLEERQITGSWAAYIATRLAALRAKGAVETDGPRYRMRKP